jgi:hypothetical protein
MAATYAHFARVSRRLGAVSGRGLGVFLGPDRTDADLAAARLEGEG